MTVAPHRLIHNHSTVTSSLFITTRSLRGRTCAGTLSKIVRVLGPG